MSLPPFEFGEADLKYAEEVLRASYAGEIDRKDKILASMTVVTPIITVLLAVVTFVFSNIIDASGGYFVLWPDPVVWFVLVLVGALLYHIGRVAFFFHKLLAAENYHYTPDANALLGHLRAMREFCKQSGEDADGLASRLMRERMLQNYADNASKNGDANDSRLRYRQRVFRATVFSVVFAAAAFMLVALHRTTPHLGWDIIEGIGHAFHRHDAAPRPATSLDTPATAEVPAVPRDQ